MENLSVWFSSLELLLQVFWVCAIAASLFFVVQLVLLLIGIDDIDVDADTLDLGGGFSLLTVKNVIHFFLGFGWAGVSLWSVIENRFWLSVVALLVGVLMVAVFIFIFKQMMKLQSQGNYNPEDAVGLMADVYIPIPAGKSGAGKVQFSLKGSVHEFQALTNGERLATGQKVQIVELLDNHTVLVEKI